MTSRTIPAWAVATLPVFLLAATSACGEVAEDENPPGEERIVVGDTTIVRSSGLGVWGDTMTLVEEMSIGAFEGADEYQFGFISDIAIDRLGGIYVFDSQVPVLRYYDESGQYVRTVGRDGEGPGEYGNASLGMAMLSDGRLVLRDPRNMRANVYDPDGGLSETWRVESGLFMGNATLQGPNDHLYMKILTGRPEPNKPVPLALLHLNERGEVVDTVVPPTLPGEPDDPNGYFSPAKQWSFSPLGGFVAGVSDRYSIGHFRPDGTVLRIEREAEPVRLLPDERADYDQMRAFQIRTQGQFMTSELGPVPDIKPAFRSIMMGEEGRIWVHQYVQAELRDPPPEPQTDASRPPPMRYREPIIFDVFEPDGTFLGTVRVPTGYSLYKMRGDLAWGRKVGEFNESYVVRLRIAAVR